MASIMMPVIIADNNGAKFGKLDRKVKIMASIMMLKKVVSTIFHSWPCNGVNKLGNLDYICLRLLTL